MIETIALWLGYFGLITIGISIFAILWYYIIHHFYNTRIEIKAIAYALASNLKMVEQNKELKNQIDMRVGRQWYIKYDGKTYLWKCVEVKE